MVSKLVIALATVGFASAYLEEAPCGTCASEGNIYCYQGKTPQTQFNRVFNSRDEFDHKCCKDARSCPEYLDGVDNPTNAKWICIKGETGTNGVIDASSIPLAECPYNTATCGKEKDLTNAGSIEI